MQLAQSQLLVLALGRFEQRRHLVLVCRRGHGAFLNQQGLGLELFEGLGQGVGGRLALGELGVGHHLLPTLAQGIELLMPARRFRAGAGAGLAQRLGQGIHRPADRQHGQRPLAGGFLGCHLVGIEVDRRVQARRAGLLLQCGHALLDAPGGLQCARQVGALGHRIQRPLDIAHDVPDRATQRRPLRPTFGLYRRGFQRRRGRRPLVVQVNGHQQVVVSRLGRTLRQRQRLRELVGLAQASHRLGVAQRGHRCRRWVQFVELAHQHAHALHLRHQQLVDLALAGDAVVPLDD